MRTKGIALMPSTVVMTLALSGCSWFCKDAARENIFDKVVNIPKELVLDIPELPPLCDELPDLKKGFADIEDGKLYYEEEGTGIPLVLINGGPGGTHHGFHPYFSQIKDIARIIYYDQRGTGKSSQDDTGKTYTVKQAVEDLENLRKALKIEKWAVLGFSYGGLLAQCYALTYPQHCIGLILVTSLLGLVLNTDMKYERERIFISPAERDAIKNINKMCHEGKITLAQDIYNQHLAGDWKHYFYFKPTNEAMIRKALYEWSPAPGFEESMRSEFGKIILQGKFDDFEIPTLATEGKWDILWPDIDKVQLMRANHPHAQVEIFEKSGHYMFADEPEKFFSLLKDFLEKSSKAQIAYKPGNRLVWPQQLHALLRSVVIAQSATSKSEHEKLIAACYEQALNEDSMDIEVWTRLIYDFIHSKKDYQKCLTALQHLEDSIKKLDYEYWQNDGYVIQAWNGHMLDLLDRRDEAVACYNEALKNNNGRNNNYFDGCMQINKQWLEKRLKVPFTWELFKN